MVEEIVCPAGTPTALSAAVRKGAHIVYCGFNDGSNTRSFPGPNFDQAKTRAGEEFAHANDARRLVAINAETRIETQRLVFCKGERDGEDRCLLSSWATGLLPNRNGTCSTASYVEYSEEQGVLIELQDGYLIRHLKEAELAPCPTLCNGCFSVANNTARSGRAAVES